MSQTGAIFARRKATAGHCRRQSARGLVAAGAINGHSLALSLCRGTNGLGSGRDDSLQRFGSAKVVHALQILVKCRDGPPFGAKSLSQQGAAPSLLVAMILFGEFQSAYKRVVAVSLTTSTTKAMEFMERHIHRGPATHSARHTSRKGCYVHEKFNQYIYIYIYI